MPAADIVRLIEICFQLLQPIAAAMVQKILAGEDPLDALAKEHVSQVIPAPLLLELAELAARAKAGKV